MNPTKNPTKNPAKIFPVSVFPVSVFPASTFKGRCPVFAALVFFLLLGGASLASAQSAADQAKPVSQMSAEELAAFIQEQKIQLDAVKQARDEQKAKHAEVQEALTERQAELNEIVTELSALCSERRKLDPNDTEPCLPDDS